MEGLIFGILRYVKVFLSSKEGIIRSTSPLHVLYINSPKVPTRNGSFPHFTFKPRLFVFFFSTYMLVLNIC